MAETVRGEGLVGIDFYPVNFIDGYYRQPLAWSPPKYYWGNVTGRMAAKIIHERGEEIVPSADTGIHQPPLQGIEAANYSYLLTPEVFWDDSDFLGLSAIINGYRFCTERVFQIARKHRWTNFFFTMLGNGRLLKRGVHLGPRKY